MTNINCSAKCIYQSDGKCCLEKISKQKITPDSGCAYFLSNNMLPNEDFSSRKSNTFVNQLIK